MNPIRWFPAALAAWQEWLRTPEAAGYGGALGCHWTASQREKGLAYVRARIDQTTTTRQPTGGTGS